MTRVRALEMHVAGAKDLLKAHKAAAGTSGALKEGVIEGRSGGSAAFAHGSF